MLEQLSPEQEALIPVVVEDYMRLRNPPQTYDPEAVKTWLTRVYAMYDKPLPDRIERCLSPAAAIRLAAELAGTAPEDTELDWMGVSDSGWVSFYDYWHRVGVLTDEEAKEPLELKAFMFSVWDAALFDECAIVVEHPELISVDSDGNLHSAIGPCIRWADGEQDFSWHGVWVPEKVIMEPTSVTRAEYVAMNSEVRRAVDERTGNAFIVGLLGAEKVSEWKDPVTGLEYALYRANETRENWLRKQSPVLQNGSQPIYYERVHEDLRTAQAARKWQATRLSAAECEKEPELVYGQEA